MFNRWRQRISSGMRKEYALDALVEYAAVPDEPSREVPNPVRPPWMPNSAKPRPAWTNCKPNTA